MTPQYGELGPLVAEISPVVWGTPAKLNGFRILAALLHGNQVVGVSQIFQIYIELILLVHCSYYIISRYCYLFINMSTIEVSYLMCSPPIYGRPM